MNKSITCLITLLILSTSLPQTVWASRSLEEIRYALFKNPNADVNEDLRKLVQFGDRQSMLLLGNQLAQQSSTSNSKEALLLFKDAFADGKGEIQALTAAAKILDNNKQMRKSYASYVKKALTQYPLTRDPRTTQATLEAFIVYPDYLDTKTVNKLISLYETSCLVYCRTELYKAVLAEKQGNKKLALQLYEKAFYTDNRAVFRYYNLLGDNQDKLFSRYTHKLQSKTHELPVTTIHSIATLLDTIYSTQHSLAALKGRQKHEITKHYTGAALEQAKTEEEELRQQLTTKFNQNENEINFWLDKAIARDWAPAMVSKVNKMTSLPDRYTPEEALSLIDKIRINEPQSAKALTVTVSMVNTWPTLNPPKSFALIQELTAEQYPAAHLLLAQLYSRGVLDEPDQTKAIRILEGEAKKGLSSALYVIAGIYYQGRAICRDKTKAYAYVLLANEFGNFRATGLMKQLQNDMTPEQKQQGLKLFNQLAKEYKI